MTNRTLMLISGLFGLSGVALGAVGAHALGAQLTASGQLENWKTAVSYQSIHAIAILTVALWLDQVGPTGKFRLLKTAATAWTIGIVLFSGSLYAFALGCPKWIWPATPLGGLAFLIGWGCIAACGLDKKSPPASP